MSLFCYHHLHMSMLRSLCIALATLAGLASAAATHAATLSPGDLIKLSSQPDVYYYGVDGKRYVFPNEKTYFTWYTGFNTKTVTDSELAAVPVGGAATYKPGVKLLKITTDPKVYAVAHGGVLRWIQTEALASEIYGTNWATKVDDLPDAFFATYKVGSPISKFSDYVPQDEMAMSPTIAADKNLSAPSPTPGPTPTSTASIALQVSKMEAQAGDVITLSSSSTHPSGIAKIDLFFDGVLVTSCTATPCSGETQIPVSGTKPQYEAKAVSTAVDETMQIKTLTVMIDGGASNLVTLSIGRSIVKVGQPAEAIVTTDASIAVIRTDIYVDGTSVKGCASAIRECRWSDVLPGGVGTVYDVYGKVTDNLGRSYLTVHKTITIGTNDSPVATMTVGKNSIFVGETVDVTASGSDDDGILKLEVMKDGVVLKSCDTAAPCTLVTGPWMEAGTISFVARATDGLGMVSTSEPVHVTVTNQN
jgi:hypothetical protein